MDNEKMTPSGEEKGLPELMPLDNEGTAETGSAFPEQNAADPADAAPAEADGTLPELANNEESADNRWLEELLKAPEAAEEISAAETAISPYAMSELSDLEFEKIMQEALSEDWDLDAAAEQTLAEPDPTPFLDNEYSDSGSADEDADQVSADAQTDAPTRPGDNADGSVPRKVRPRRKKGYGLFGLPHIASTAIWIALCLAIGISLGRWVWVCAADVLAFGRPDQDVTITITSADTLDSITEKLYDAGLIKYRSLFKMYAKLAQVEEKDKISVGTFELNTQYDYHALVGGMSATSSYRQTTEVTIPEGYTCAQIYALLEEKGVCSAADLEAYAMESEFSSYWFLEGVEKGTKYCLEGFLFPSTYQFYTDATPKHVFSKMLAAFEDQFDADLQAQIATLNETLTAMYKRNGLSQEYIDSHQFTVREVVIVASMIEKEAAHTGEMRNISSVIYNRLTNPSNYPYLNIDATIVYALGGKSDLTEEDKKLDSPYNTYLYAGLTPGPISNPSLFSLKAALDPTETSYYFYALDPTAEIREHKFFKTYKEHTDFLESLGY